MQTIFKMITLLCFFVLSSFAKEIVFDLERQDFINSLGDKQLSTKYNLNDRMIIHTNLLKNEQGVYHTNSDNIGRFDLHPSIPMVDWKFNLDIQYEGLKDKNRFIKFTDMNGEVILLEFNTAGFIFNSIDYNAKIDKKHLFIQIVKNGESVEFYLNKQLIDTQMTNFEKLKSIETTIFKFSIYDQDKLNNILLVSND